MEEIKEEKKQGILRKLTRKNEKEEVKTKLPDFKNTDRPYIITNNKGAELLNVLGDVALKTTGNKSLRSVTQLYDITTVLDLDKLTKEDLIKLFKTISALKE